MENNQNENNVIEQEVDQEQQAPAQPPEKEKKKKGGLFRSNRFKRGGMATVMTAVFLAIVVVVNILVGALTDRFPSMNIDLTADKLNSLSDQALEIAKGIEQDTSIYLIGSEEAYRKNQLYASYNIQYSQVANLAKKLQEANSHISVEFIDPDTNPTFISSYPEENLVSGCVLVKTEKRHKTLNPNDLFSIGSGSTGVSYDVYSKVDSALAGALEVVNMENVPVLTMITGHGELLTEDSLGAFTSLMEDENFEVKKVDFVTEDIPEDTQVLMIPCPATDYTAEEVDKLREFLDNEENDKDVTLLVTCHPTQGDLPNLEGFLEEWGVQVEQGMVAETDSTRVALRSSSFVLVDADKEILTEEEYGALITASASPITLLFEGNGSVNTKALWTTADTAYVATEDMTEAEMEDPQTGVQTVASMSQKYVKKETVRRSVIVFGSSYIFTESFMDATAFGNRKYIPDLLQYAIGADDSSVKVLDKKVQTNVLDVSASSNTVNLLGLGVFTVGLPVAILAAGLIIFLKRRHL